MQDPCPECFYPNSHPEWLVIGERLKFLREFVMSPKRIQERIEAGQSKDMPLNSLQYISEDVGLSFAAIWHMESGRMNPGSLRAFWSRHGYEIQQHQSQPGGN